MGDLAQRVHAGIGAAGGDDGHGLAGEGQDRRLSAACTDGPLAWRCQPRNGPPSYSSSKR